MLSAWVPSKRPRGAPHMTYGRSLVRALDNFCISRERWHEHATDRAGWRKTLRCGLAPAEFQQRPLSPQPLSPRIARTKPKRAATAAADYTATNHFYHKF